MFSRLLRSVGELRTDRWRPGLAALLALGTAIPILLGLLRGDVQLGVLASIGGLYTGLAAFGNVHRVRLRRMAITSVAVAALAGLGSLANGSDVASIAGVAVVGFLFALFGAASAVNNLAGLFGTGIFVVLSGGAPNGHGPVVIAFAMLAGGLVQTALIAVFGPLFPRAAEREAVAGAYASLARYARHLAEKGEAPVPEALPFREARVLLAEGVANGASDEHARLQHALRVAETLRAGIVGFARAHLARIANGGDSETARRMVTTLEKDLHDLGEAVEAGRYNVQASLAVQPPFTGVEEYDRWLRLLVAAFEELTRPPLPVEGSVAAESPRGNWIGAFRSLWQSESLRALTLAHAFRFGIALAVATAIFRLGHVPLGYWIPLTVAFLLRPDYSTTLLKSFGRFLGTFAGVVLATLFASVAPHDPWIYALMAIASGWCLFSLYEVSFALYMVALTFYVVIGLTALGRSEPMIGIDRVGATAAGALVAVVATFLWPVWESKRIRSAFCEAFQAQVAFGDVLSRLIHREDVESAEQLRHRARSLRSEAERLVEALRLEPPWSRTVEPKVAEGWMEHLAENAAVLLSLHAQALEHRAGRIPEEPRAREALQRAISEARLMTTQLAK